jgi:HAE1 family hydrophobic/amphiphilic exporter-1
MRTLGLILAAALAASAQEPVRVGVGVIERKLSLAETLEMSLRNNLDIEIERTSIATSRQNFNAAKGAFDGVFRWQPLFESRNTPTTNVLFAANGKLVERFHNQNFGYQQKLPWQGASVQAGFNNSRQSTNNPFAGLNPYTQSSFVLGVTLPLWRSRLTDRDRAELRIRSKAINISEADLELRVIDVVNRAELAYWDLVSARQGVGVAAEGVQWGQEQTARSKRMIDAGTLAPVELSGAEAELERRRDTYFAAINTVTDAENVLKTLIASGKEDPIWNDAIIPTDQNTVDAPATGDVQSAIDLSLKKRPELRHVTLRRESNDVQKELAADQLKPQVNLIANYTNSGLAGTIPVGAAANPFTASSAAQLQRINELSARAGLAPLPATSFGTLPPSLIGGYGTVLSSLFGGNYPGIQVGLAMDWNTRNQTAKANSAIAAINEKRLGLERMRTEQAIVAQVRTAMQAIETARQRIQAAESSARAAKEKLDSETRLFQVGESTSFLVLTRQNEYTDSLRRAVVSRLELNRAVARYQQATGNTLETHKLSVR